MSNNSLVTVPFHGQSLLATLVNDIPHVALKPICENLGVDWEGQRQKINRHPVLKQVACMIKATSLGQDGKSYFVETIMLPVKFINGWLFSIDSNRVKPEIQQRLVEYQTECFEVLANHFMPKAEAAKPDPLDFSKPMTLAEFEQRTKALQATQNALKDAQVILSGADIARINDSLRDNNAFNAFASIMNTPVFKSVRWTDHHKKELCELYNKGYSRDRIAREMSRTHNSISYAIAKFLTKKAGV